MTRSRTLAHVVYRTRRFAIANLDVLRPDDGEREQKGLIGLDHVAYTLDSIDDLLENYTDLKERGIEPYWCVHHGHDGDVSRRLK